MFVKTLSVAKAEGALFKKTEQTSYMRFSSVLL